MWRLRRNGLSFAALARNAGVSQQAVHQAAMGGISERLEALIAEAIGLAPKALFAERYTKNGGRLGIGKSTKRLGKNSGSTEPHNVEKPEAA